MSNNRSWTWIDEDQVSEEEMDRRRPAIDDLAAKWNHLHNKQEEAGFRRQAAFESGEFDEPEFDSDEEAESFEIRRRVASRLETAQINAIEAELKNLGARMCRPYEHWNEDERLMEYMERDRY